MIFDLETLNKRTVLMLKPDPREDDLKSAIELSRDALIRFGYLDSPASPALREWMARYTLYVRKATRPPELGLALMGTVGTGKTTALRIISAILHFQFVPVYDLAIQYAADGDAGLREQLLQWRGHPLVLDDVGSEGESKHYGVSLPLVDILSARYDDWQINGTPTLISGNLSASEREERYGQRFADRFSEMFEVVPCCWSSFRKAKQTKGGEA